MENERLVSVIVPVYNAGQYLEECLESIMRQTYKNIEIILVDDDSKDESKTIIKDYMRMDDRFVLLEHEVNKGVSKSRNDAMAYAHGDYMVCVDADDKVAIDFVEELVTAIRDSDICICGYTKFDQKRSELFLLQRDEIDNYEKIMFHVLCSNRIGGYMWNKLFKRELIDGISLDEDLSIGEDMLFVVRYLERCKKIAYIHKTLYQYRINPASAMRCAKINQEMNWSKLTSIKSAERIQNLLKGSEKHIRNYCSYRVAKTNLWLLFQMIICRKNDREVQLIIKKNIKENYDGYKRVAYGGMLQHIVLFVAKFNPEIVRRVGIIANTFFSKTFQARLMH